MERLKILIAGGSGFIGSRLVEKLYRYHDIIVIDKKQPRYNSDVYEGITTLRLDINIKKNVDKFPRADIVYNFASPSSIMQFNKENFNELANSSFAGFLNMLEYSKINNVSKYIFPSSGTVYGSSESVTRKELEPITIYGVMKLAHEKLAALYKNSFDITGLRIFMGYGPGEEMKEHIASPAYLFLSDILKDKSPTVWGDGSQSRDLIFIDDIIEVLEKSLKLTGFNIFDVGSGKQTSFNELIRQINKVTNREIAPKFVEKPKTYLDHTVADISYLRERFSFPLTTVEDGLQKFYYYLSNLN